MNTKALSIPKKEAMENVGTRFPPDVLATIKQLAKTHKCTIADIVRLSVDEFIKNHNFA